MTNAIETKQRADFEARMTKGMVPPVKVMAQPFATYNNGDYVHSGIQIAWSMYKDMMAPVALLTTDVADMVLALRTIRQAGNNTSKWAEWAQKMAAWGMGFRLAAMPDETAPAEEPPAPPISLNQAIIDHAHRFALHTSIDTGVMQFNAARLIDLLHHLMPTLIPIYAPCPMPHSDEGCEPSTTTAAPVICQACNDSGVVGALAVPCPFCKLEQHADYLATGTTPVPLSFAQNTSATPPAGYKLVGFSPLQYSAYIAAGWTAQGLIDNGFLVPEPVTTTAAPSVVGSFEDRIRALARRFAFDDHNLTIYGYDSEVIGFVKALFEDEALVREGTNHLCPLTAQEIAEVLIRECYRTGQVVTISLEPLKPFAMGSHHMVADFREVRK